MANNYIQNEVIPVDGVNFQFNLANSFRAGTLLVKYNGKLFYEFYENKVTPDIINFDFVPDINDVITVSYYRPSQPGALNAIRYITTRQVVSLSRVTNIGDEDVILLERTIRDAEKYIDSVVGFWPKFYERLSSQSGQSLTFPRVHDDPDRSNGPTVDYAFIPAEITQAALYAVENIFLNGVQKAADDGAGPVTSVKFDNFSTTKADLGFGKTQEDFIISIIGGKAFSMLRGFIKKTGTLSEDISVIDGAALNSRQLFIKNNPYL